MKPVIIIAIAVVCSVGAVLGILVILQEINNLQSQEISKDFDLARAYQIEYDEIMAKTCMPKPSSTYEKGLVYEQAMQESAKQKLEYFTSKMSALENLNQNMKSLQEKYPNNDYFEFELIDCPYDEEWVEIKSLFDKRTDRILSCVSLQYQKCLDENNNEFECDSKLEEFTETAKLIYGYN